ncbi:S24 family peptidase [Pannonibacter indicus]|uniref:LexA family transcriptional regulator n=1 Tax=Pannonibacter indicus TaxID=466044 RepID=UPI00391D8EBC
MSDDWISIIEREAKARGMSLQALAVKADLDRAYFRIVRQRPNSWPRGDTMLKLSRALGTSVPNLLDQANMKPSGEPNDLSAPPSMTLVPELTVRVGAGGGGVPAAFMDLEGTASADSEGLRNKWGLPDTFLENEARIAPKSAYIMEVMGDSMTDPTNPLSTGSFLPGDRVIFDTSDRTPSPPGAFVLWDGYSMVLKMVEIVHGSDPLRLRLSSKNPAYKSYEVLSEEANIAGRVRARITLL